MYATCDKQSRCQKRLAEHEGPKTWRVDTYTVNGTDSLQWVKDSILNCESFRLDFYGAWAKSSYNTIRYYDDCGSDVWTEGRWSMDNCNTLWMRVQYDSISLFEKTWQLEKLKKTEIDLISQEGDKEYVLKLR